MKYGDILQEIGGWGRYQKFVTFLVVLNSASNGFYTMTPVFVLDIPEHHCTISPGNATGENVTVEDLLNSSIPWEKDDSGEWKRSECEFYSIMGDNSSKTKCDNGWTFYPKYGEETGFMEWNVVCDRSWIKPLVLALLMSGILVGSLISGAVADRFGRRPALLWGLLFHFVSLFLMGFSTGPYMFGGLLFIVGASGMVKYAAGFVIISEIVEASKRALVGILISAGFCFGYMILPLFSYFMSDWRWLIWFAGAVGVLFLPYYWVLPESPRWLITNGRREAKDLIKKIAKYNKVTIADDSLVRMEKELSDSDGEEETRKQFTYIDLFKIPGIRSRSLIMCFLWFSASMSYYCISLGTSDLGGNKFVNCFISAAVELPSLLSALYLMDRFGRKFVLVGFLVFGGTCLVLASAFLKIDALLITFAMISKFCVSGAFTLVYTYCCELIPTKMRNMSIGISSTMARAGGIVAPYLTYAGEEASPIIPYIAMGGCVVVSGCLTLLLPETLNVPLPETVEDAVNMGRKKIKKSKTDDDALEKLNMDTEEKDKNML